VYVATDAHEVEEDQSIATALATIYRRKQQPLPALSSFSDASPQRIYVAVAREAWTNVVHTDGECPWDERVDVSLE
jgi:hypothetical protein